MSDIDTYSKHLANFYVGGTDNHEHHNKNTKYFEVLLKDITLNPSKWENKNGLDFGCGKGRNVTNLINLAKFNRVDGVDISKKNISFCKNSYKNQNSNFYLINGFDLKDIEDHTYDYAMSTIVFQHICVHEMRYKIKQEIYRVLKNNSIFSFQMGYGDNLKPGQSAYSDNKYDTKTSNGRADVKIQPQTINHLVSDLESIGFKNLTYEIHESYSDSGHPNWIYVRCEK